MFSNIWRIMQENKFEFDNEISSELICSICKCLMINACNAPCGCRFCSDCIEHYLDGKDKFCPGAAKRCERKTINFASDIVADNHANIRISEVIVRCPRPNCQFKDELEVMESHMRTCDKRPISCPFNVIGCAMNDVGNDEMKGHLNENHYDHSNLLIDHINNLSNQMESILNENVKLRMEITELKYEMRQFKQQFDNINVKLSNIERKEADNSGEIEELNEEMVVVKNENRSLRMEMETNIGSINQLRQQIEAIETKCQQQIDEMKEKCEQRLQHENAKLQLEMAKCANEIRLIETKLGNEKCINYGFLEWQIDKLSQQVRDQLIYSNAFYSGPSGYKMCLGVWISSWYGGDIWVGFHLMRGENDEQLDWPFKHAVNVDVIDPASGNIRMSKSVKYSDWTDAAARRKPTNDRNDPIGIYYADATGNSTYKFATKNDKLLLRCKIEKL